MTHRGIAKLIEYLRRDAAQGPDLLPDGELLARFAASRDEAAFELLVRRHGALVLGTARRVLRDAHAAEDVFQAVFLALARKANSLRHGQALPGWLHRVSLRASLRARPRPTPAVARTEYVDPDTVGQAELRAVLDEEIARLPGRFRDAVVLCYLDGLTTGVAARQLGCPRGTVLSRLAAARERLRLALTGRGYGLPAAGVAALFTSEAASASLVALAVRAGLGAAISPAVARIAEGVLHAMVLTKLKAAVAVVLAAGMITVGVGSIGAGPPAANGDVKGEPEPAFNNDGVFALEIRCVEIHLARQLLAKALEETSKSRLDKRIEIEQCQDEIAEALRRREPLQRQIGKFEEELVALRMSLMEVKQLVDQGVIKDTDFETLKLKVREPLLAKSIEELRARDADLQRSIRELRRRLLGAEEALKLQEQLAALETERMHHAIKAAEAEALNPRKAPPTAPAR